VHLLNSVFALFEILLTNTPASAWILLPPGLLLLIGYVGVVYVTFATQGFYAYSFMNPNGHPGKLALYIGGIGVAECIIFAAVHGLVLLRQRAVTRLRPAPSPTEDKSVSSSSDAWADVDINSTSEKASSKFEV